jgi:DUF4097 and DUF4098 domain-containing protein YvlB
VRRGNDCRRNLTDGQPALRNPQTRSLESRRPRRDNARTTARSVQVDTRRYDLPIAVTLRLQSRSGKVHAIAEPREDIEAETDELESFFDDNGRTLVIRSSRGGSKPLLVRCPVDTDLVIGTHSGGVTLEGGLGSVRVTTMSGSVSIDHAEEADVRTMSGSIEVGTVRGRARLNAISGKVTAVEVDDASASTVSGLIRLDRVLGAARVRSVSGSIDMHASGDGQIAVKTVSGRVRIVLPEGTEPATVFKTRGNVRCDFARGSDCRIEAASLSGSIEVVPA